MQKKLRTIFCKEVIYFTYVYCYLINFKKVFKLNFDQVPNIEQLEIFYQKIYDFLLCTIAHLHMIFILRMELFLSNFPKDKEILKI